MVFLPNTAHSFFAFSHPCSGDQPHGKAVANIIVKAGRARDPPSDLFTTSVVNLERNSEVGTRNVG
jgi:hypothetical protein